MARVDPVATRADNETPRSPRADAPPCVRVCLGVGSNIDPESNIPAALRLLGRASIVSESSTFYRTAPLRRPDQPPFINGVWVMQWRGTPSKLKFELLRSIEDQLGRRRTADTHAPRTIDLDILLFGDLVCDAPGLRIPSSDISRPFVAVPLREVIGEMTLPGSNVSLGDLCATCDTSGMTPLPELSAALRKDLGR